MTRHLGRAGAGECPDEARHPTHDEEKKHSKRCQTVDVPIIKLEPQRLMQIDERRLAGAIVRYGALVDTDEPP
jgi:hypothetical protein